MRDTIGLIMLDQGKDPANFTDDDFNAAIAMLQKAKDSGQIRAFTGNEYIQSAGEGRHRRLHGVVRRRDRSCRPTTRRSSCVRRRRPGVMQWSDNMLIPNKASTRRTPSWS